MSDIHFGGRPRRRRRPVASCSRLKMACVMYARSSCNSLRIFCTFTASTSMLPAAIRDCVERSPSPAGRPSSPGRAIAPRIRRTSREAIGAAAGGPQAAAVVIASTHRLRVDRAPERQIAQRGWRQHGDVQRKGLCGSGQCATAAREREAARRPNCQFRPTQAAPLHCAWVRRREDKPVKRRAAHPGGAK